MINITDKDLAIWWVDINTPHRFGDPLQLFYRVEQRDNRYVEAAFYLPVGEKEVQKLVSVRITGSLLKELHRFQQGQIYEAYKLLHLETDQECGILLIYQPPTGIKFDVSRS